MKNCTELAEETKLSIENHKGDIFFHTMFYEVFLAEIIGRDISFISFGKASHKDGRLIVRALIRKNTLMPLL